MELLGSSAPDPFLRKALRGSGCMRRALNEHFVLSSPLGMICHFLSSKYFFYKYEQEFYKTLVLSDDDEESEVSVEESSDVDDFCLQSWI